MSTEPNKSMSVTQYLEKAKAVFMEACLKDHDKDSCERMFKPMTSLEWTKLVQDEDTTLELAKAQIQRDQALELLKQKDAEQKAKDDMEKAVLIVKISQDNKLFNRRVLSRPNFSLRLLRRLDNILAAYQQNMSKYDSQVSAEDAAGKIKKGLTVGEWDSEKGEWKT